MLLAIDVGNTNMVFGIFSRHHIHFDLECITADTSPCESTHNTNFIFFICHLITVKFLTQIVFHIPLCHMNGFLLFLKDLHC